MASELAYEFEKFGQLFPDGHQIIFGDAGKRIDFKRRFAFIGKVSQQENLRLFRNPSLTP
jgi:hypothetical protein